MSKPLTPNRHLSRLSQRPTDMIDHPSRTDAESDKPSPACPLDNLGMSPPLLDNDTEWSPDESNNNIGNNNENDNNFEDNVDDNAMLDAPPTLNVSHTDVCDLLQNLRNDFLKSIKDLKRLDYKTG